MKLRLKRARTVAGRVFLIYCILYTLTGVLFDHRSSGFSGITEAACTPQYIGTEVEEEELKQRLVDEFVPTLVFSYGEPANLNDEVIVPYQIVPDRADTGRWVWRGAVTYPMDYGATSFGVRLSIGTNGQLITLSKTVLRALGWALGRASIDAHVGDAEMFELYLKPSAEAGYWQIDSLRLFPHGGAKTYTARQVRCFRDSPIFYVSRGKHAMYPSLQECNHSSVANRRGIHLTAESCNIGELYFPSISPEFNVGDSANPNNIFETSPTLVESGIYDGEDVWGDCFFGGSGIEPRPCRSRFRWW